MVPGLPITQHAENPRSSSIARDGNLEAKHMLAWLHDNVTRTLPLPKPSASLHAVMLEERKWCFIRCATELHEAGIKFQKKEGNMFHIEFQKEVMSIPTLIIDDHTESILRNFVAYEQYVQDSSPKPFTDYITFMDRLINTGKDVELLCRCGVLDNWLGDHEVVATMLNRLGDSVLFSDEDFFYSDIFTRVNEHCNRKWNLLEPVCDKSFKLEDQSTHPSTTAYASAGGLEITCFSELVDDATFHFQIILFPKQSNTVGVTSVIGGSSDNTGSGIARRLVLKTGLNIIFACNIAKNSPMLEV
ncbi:hypothetical protein SLEP1_g38486 [Rubroshorea leprosula]|nr:hypothetical protein SLEP1_g38486 [Rubroshorea leprosula]